MKNWWFYSNSWPQWFKITINLRLSSPLSFHIYMLSFVKYLVKMLNRVHVDDARIGLKVRHIHEIHLIMAVKKNSTLLFYIFQASRLQVMVERRYKIRSISLNLCISRGDAANQAYSILIAYFTQSLVS